MHSLQAMKNAKARGALALMAAAVLSGCSGNDWQAATYPVTGTVMINGEPAVDAVVELRATGDKKPDSRNSKPWGIVQEDGSYSLTTYQKGDGAPPGEYVATLRWPTDLSTPSHVDRLSGAYSTETTAPLKSVTIKTEPNELPPIELTDVKVLPPDEAAKTRKRPPGPGPKALRK